MLDRFFTRLPKLTDQAPGSPVAGPCPTEASAVLSADAFAAAEQEIRQWPGYAPTPLRDMDLLAAELDLGAVLFKDEGGRFGLGSFKALGGAYAVMRLLANELSRTRGANVSMTDVRSGVVADQVSELTVVAATDGNHGRSVAWGAQQAGCRCRIYLHEGVSAGREQALRELGAEVVRTPGDYDASVRICADEAAQHGWHVVSDTSYPGYDQIPRDVMAGYGVMATEILTQRPDGPPSHVFLQAGVGGMAAALCTRFWLELGADRPRFVIVEADRAPSLLASARAGAMRNVEIEEETLMAGLSCGEVSPLAWEVLSRGTEYFVTVSDDDVAPAMRALASGDLGGDAIEGGECAAPGLLALIAMAKDPALRQAIALDGQSQVLLIGSEGATDPDIYQSLLAAP